MRVSGGAPAMDLEHYQTAFAPLLYGVGSPSFSPLLEGNGTGGAAGGPAASGGPTMTRTTGTGKYEQLLERCRSLEPVPTAVAHPCEETALAGAIEAGAKGLIAPILVGPAAKIHEVASEERHRPRTTPDRRRAAQPCRGRARRWSWSARARPSC